MADISNPMLTAILFTRAKLWNLNLNISCDEQMQNMQYSNKVENYLAKNNS